MELVFKVPEGKPPFVGVCFESIYDAMALNEHFVHSGPAELFTLAVHPGTRLKLLLVRNRDFEKATYSDLAFDPEKFRRFRQVTAGCKRLNFGHVVKERSAHKLVKTMHGNKNFVLRVGEFRVIEF